MGTSLGWCQEFAWSIILKEGLCHWSAYHTLINYYERHNLKAAQFKNNSGNNQAQEFSVSCLAKET